MPMGKTHIQYVVYTIRSHDLICSRFWWACEFIYLQISPNSVNDGSWDHAWKLTNKGWGFVNNFVNSKTRKMWLIILIIFINSAMTNMHHLDWSKANMVWLFCISLHRQTNWSTWGYCWDTILLAGSQVVGLKCSLLSKDLP